MPKNKESKAKKEESKFPGLLCGWCDGTGSDKKEKCPLCLGKGRRFPSDKGDKARYDKLYSPKKSPNKGE